MLKQLLEKQEKLRADLAKVFAEAGDETDFDKVKHLSGSAMEKITAVRKMNEDLEVASKSIDDLRAVEKTKADFQRREMEIIKANRSGKTGAAQEEDEAGEAELASKHMSLGEAFIKAGGHLKENRDKEVKLSDKYQLKTDFVRSAGWSPQSLRTGRLVDYPVRPIVMMDIIPMERTGYAAVKYMEETTLDGSLGVEVAEGGTYGAAQLALTERSVTVEKLPVYLPVTDEQLEDVEQAQSYIDNRLPAIILRRLDSQSLNGNGTTPNMRGVLNASGLLSRAASAGDGIADTILRAITDVRLTGRAIASAIVMHQTDWTTERLRKDKNGNYIWGNPGDVGISTMWGLPVAQTDALAQGTAVVGDFRVYSAYVERRGLVMKTGYINDDFIKGRQAIRADLRGCFVWYRGSAFVAATLP